MTVTESDVRAVIDKVPDPEMPPVSVGDLGMVVDVRVAPGAERPSSAHVEVDLVPTFSGCPATGLIRDDVTAAIGELAGVDSVDVRFVADVVWDPERITPRGRERLRAFGIAPPGSGQTLLQISRPQQGIRCPVCGSRDTVLDSPFGPTPCRSTSYCRACRNPFEAIKP